MKSTCGRLLRLWPLWLLPVADAAAAATAWSAAASHHITNTCEYGIAMAAGARGRSRIRSALPSQTASVRG
eukprot:SAG25_NODE_1621_length_2660_cov_0.979695_6_plen_70_part_01